MAFYNVITNLFQKAKTSSTPKKTNVVRLKDMMTELGIRSSEVIGSFSQEENPDAKAPDTYIYMQNNDGTVRSIVRLFTTPIVATPISVIPHKDDSGEADFIRTVFFSPEHQGGMSTPLPLVVADMCRGIFEGFRLYEKVPQVITEGEWKGKIGWRKLAPRDSTTITLRSDDHGGFNGAHQVAFGPQGTVDVMLPPAKCLLFTFQRERHPLYGESLLKTAFYHYDKKHKLYYLAHKKAEMDAVGLKILKFASSEVSDNERTAAEEAVSKIGVSSRLTLPEGIDLEIDRASSGYSVMGMIEHHDMQMRISSLAQATQLGTQQKYAYPYGKGYKYQNLYLVQSLRSIMAQMTSTLNQWAVAPLIDYNFNTKAYPTLQFEPIADEHEQMVQSIFESLLKKKETVFPAGFTEEIFAQVAERLGLELQDRTPTTAEKAFESGKMEMADTLKFPAPKTTNNVRAQINKHCSTLKNDSEFFEKFAVMGKDYSLNSYFEQNGAHAITT